MIDHGDVGRVQVVDQDGRVVRPQPLDVGADHEVVVQVIAETDTETKLAVDIDTRATGSATAGRVLVDTGE